MQPAALTTEEILLFRSLEKTASVLMLIFRLGRQVGRREIARLFDIDEGTAGKRLNDLVTLSLLTRTHHKRGYALTRGGLQMILPLPADEIAAIESTMKNPTMKKPLLPPTTTTTLYLDRLKTIDHIEKLDLERDIKVVVEEKATVKKTLLLNSLNQLDLNFIQAWSWLREYGIGRTKSIDLIWSDYHFEFYKAHIMQAIKQSTPVPLFIHQLTEGDAVAEEFQCKEFDEKYPGGIISKTSVDRLILKINHPQIQDLPQYHYLKELTQ